MFPESLKFLSLGVMAALFLAACSPVGTAVGAAATVTNMAMEERGFITSVDDKLIWVSINNRLLNYDKKTFETVSLQVHEGRVILTGTAATARDKLMVTRLSWQTGGVREVHNDLKITNAKRDLGTIVDDTWLKKRLELALLADPQVRSSNYSIECIDGTIYLIGVARDNTERQRVIDRARDVPYVRAVISYVRLVTDPLPPEPLDRNKLAQSAPASP